MVLQGFVAKQKKLQFFMQKGLLFYYYVLYYLRVY